MNIRRPVVSGMFYPAKKDTLIKLINDLINQANIEENEKSIFGLISPHAGYIYSGPTAAYGYKLLKNKKFDTIIILGPSHYTLMKGASVWPDGKYETPLGFIDIDSEVTNFLLTNNEHIEFNQIAHIQEHSIEVQLPFLQVVLKEDFKFVPIIVGNQQYEYVTTLAESLTDLLKTIKKEYLIIASSDLSHYHSADVAQRLDKNVTNAIAEMDIKKLNELIQSQKGEACGIGPIMTLLLLSKNFNYKNIEILNLSNSGDTSGDYSRVVGYLSAAIYKE